MMTKDQYIESLRKLHLNLYSFGKKVENVVDNPTSSVAQLVYGDLRAGRGPAVRRSDDGNST
ncbi:MAG: hypothetical protein ACLVB4_07920 [Butyricicoccus sp.]